MSHEIHPNLFAKVGESNSFAFNKATVFPEEQENPSRVPSEIPTLRYQLQQARKEERLYIARELHDQTIQELIALGFKLANLEQIKGQHLCQEIRLLRSELGIVIRQLRSTISQLRSQDAGLLPFKLGLERALERWSGSKTLPHVHLDIASEVDTLPVYHRICLFRVIQEGLHNIIKHAKADQAWINLLVKEGQIDLNIQDNGSGFQVPAFSLLREQQHFGLLGIVERVKLLRGTVSIHSNLGIGSTLCVHLPIFKDTYE
jgi:signal transduction histidine kinase